MSFPKGHDVLLNFVLPGNRNGWDRIYLENRGGKTALELKHVLIVMNYENPAGLSPDEVSHNHIPIVDARIRKTLREGRHRIRLCKYARRSRYKWAGISKESTSLVKAIARDLGKSGSDGKGEDKYGENPKYGGSISHLCSEFASWYYHKYDVKIKRANFRDIVRAQELHDLFEKAGRLYFYKNKDNTWRNTKTKRKYIPKAGDYLERRNQEKAEHSMVMLRWEPETCSADVFNGPWPVTLRRVRIGFEEEKGEKSYFLGRID